MSPRFTLNHTLASVLQAVAAGSRYGFDVIDVTQLPSGTVYPALSRLEEDGYLTSHWEDHRIAQREKRPPRKYYAVTARGDRTLALVLKEYRDFERATRARVSRRPARSRS
jgi:DNA-binding PadR family transcriptional regulator